MARNWVGKIAFGLMGVGLCVGAGKANARPAITDYEASKLTFDALTAVPVYHHVTFHHAVHHAAARRSVVAWSASHAVVRNVAYRPRSAPAHMLAASAHHRAHARRT